MKRSVEEADRKAKEELKIKMIDDSHWRAVYSDSVLSKERPKVRVVYETSYLKMPSGSASAAEGTATGRRSFNSFKQNADALKSEQDASAQQAVEEQIRSEKLKTPRPSKLSSTAPPKPQKAHHPANGRNSQLKRKHE
ncbi:hypothetical protein EV175_004850 [Coemansia sp. RSA 1933]|nr:hypothetical protein EV175_004850 [Coemansia sp. RSA 1933]